ncbi:MAG: enoyl-CoA hydratase [Ilumatobacteraceae bacterium]
MDLEIDRRDRVLVLRINRPEVRNALSPEVVRGLGKALMSADADEAVRAVVITGTGDRAFCAGMDLRAFAAADSSDRSVDDAYLSFIRHGIAKPVIAAANATAVAGGFELLLACDLAVAASDARFGLPEVKRGLFAAAGGMQLGRRIPLAVALELALTGDLIDAERAQELGLLNFVVAREQVLDAALGLAARISANGPLAVRTTKRLIRDAIYSSREQAWAQQDSVFDDVFASADAKEGALAFVEKRQPQWTGT